MSFVGEEAATTPPRAQVVPSWSELRQLWGQGLIFPEVLVDLVRHGESTINQRGLISGSLDADLSTRGQHEATLLGRALRPPYSAVYASELRRSQETARLALGAAGRSMPIVIDWRLNERSLGELEGEPTRFVREFAQGQLDYAPPGGDSYLETSQRCMAFLLDLSHRDLPAGGRLLLSTHSGPLRIFKAIFEPARSAQEMMEYTFQNAELISYSLGRVKWPKFLPDAGR